MAMLLVLGVWIGGWLLGPYPAEPSPTVESTGLISTSMDSAGQQIGWPDPSELEVTSPSEFADTNEPGQPVPDPSTVLLVLAGVGLIVGSRRYGLRKFSW